MEWVKESSELMYSVTRLQRASSSKLYYNTADVDPTHDLLIFLNRNLLSEVHFTHHEHSHSSYNALHGPVSLWSP